MSNPPDLPHRKRPSRGQALFALSFIDDIGLLAFAQHGRAVATKAAFLGPKGIVAGCLIGLAAGAAWCVAARRAKRTPTAIAAAAPTADARLAAPPAPHPPDDAAVRRRVSD